MQITYRFHRIIRRSVIQRQKVVFHFRVVNGSYSTRRVPSSCRIKSFWRQEKRKCYGRVLMKWVKGNNTTDKDVLNVFCKFQKDTEFVSNKISRSKPSTVKKETLTTCAIHEKSRCQNCNMECWQQQFQGKLMYIRSRGSLDEEI